MAEQKDKCPDCKGRGHVYYMNLQEHSPCPTCNGIGEKKLDRPDREIKRIIKPYCAALYPDGCKSDGDNLSCQDCNKKVDQIIALFPDIVAKLKQAVKDTRDGKDIDLPEELYEVFCSIQNQAIKEAKREERERITKEIEEKFPVDDHLDENSLWQEFKKQALKGGLKGEKQA